MKEEVKGDAELRAAFEAADTAAGVLAALEGTERGRRFLAERIARAPASFGYKAIWSHEFVYTTWVEDPAPIVEAVRGYLATDYDYPAAIQAVRDDLEAAKAEVHGGRRGRGRATGCRRRSTCSLAHEPAHARPPLLHRPGHQRPAAARCRGDRPQAGRGGRPRRPRGRRVPALQRAARCCSPTSARSTPRELVSDRRDAHEDAFERRPPSWVGTATEAALGVPVRRRCGASRRSSTPASRRPTGEVKGLAASPGVVEGTARYVTSLDEFDEVEQGDILVCRMTNPAWVVLFTKIRGARDRGRRHDVAPGRRGARVRDPGRRGHDERRRADQDGRPRCGSTAPPASSRCWA